jgi:hypothetical protein
MPTWKKIFENFDKRLDHEEIDEFLDHLNASISRRIKKLEEEANNLSVDQFDDPEDIEGYRYHLEELAASAYSAKNLGDELSIVALYKKVEGHTARVVKRKLPSAASVNLSYFNKLCSVLPFDIKLVDGFSGFNELRLLNNSIKHGGAVSAELAKEFPHWIEKSELSGLDKAFQRLLPLVKRYVKDLVERVYAAAP